MEPKCFASLIIVQIHLIKTNKKAAKIGFQSREEKSVSSKHNYWTYKSAIYSICPGWTAQTFNR